MHCSNGGAPRRAYDLSDTLRIVVEDPHEASRHDDSDCVVSLADAAEMAVSRARFIRNLKDFVAIEFASASSPSVVTAAREILSVTPTPQALRALADAVAREGGDAPALGLRFAADALEN